VEEDVGWAGARGGVQCKSAPSFQQPQITQGKMTFCPGYLIHCIFVLHKFGGKWITSDDVTTVEGWKMCENHRSSDEATRRFEEETSKWLAAVDPA